MGKPSDVKQAMILILDGHEVGTVNHLAGGQAVSNVTEGMVDTTSLSIRRRTALNVEPIVVEVGALRPVLGWISALLSRQHDRRTFELRHGRDVQGSSRAAFECLLTDIAFPALDRRSAGDAYLTLKVQPERAVTRRTQVPRRHSPPMLPLSGHMFRLSIDGALDGNEVQRLEAFAIKSGLKKAFVGDDRFPSIEPTKLEFPNLTIHLPAAQAQRLKSWHEALLANRSAPWIAPRTGRLELFSRGGTRVMILELSGLHLVSLAIMNTASAKVGIACGGITING